MSPANIWKKQNTKLGGNCKMGFWMIVILANLIVGVLVGLTGVAGFLLPIVYTGPPGHGRAGGAGAELCGLYRFRGPGRNELQAGGKSGYTLWNPPEHRQPGGGRCLG